MRPSFDKDPAFVRELYPPVRIDLMHKAMAKFNAVLNRLPEDRQRYKKARADVGRAVKEDWLHERVYSARCHAFDNIMKKLDERTMITYFGKWLTVPSAVD
jgi:hypothetical protein